MTGAGGDGLGGVEDAAPADRHDRPYRGRLDARHGLPDLVYPRIRPHAAQLGKGDALLRQGLGNLSVGAILEDRLAPVEQKDALDPGGLQLVRKLEDRPPAEEHDRRVPPRKIFHLSATSPGTGSRSRSDLPGSVPLPSQRSNPSFL